MVFVSAFGLIGNTSTGGNGFYCDLFPEKSGRDIWNYILCGNAVILTVAGLLFGLGQGTVFYYFPVYFYHR